MSELLPMLADAAIRLSPYQLISVYLRLVGADDDMQAEIFGQTDEAVVKRLKVALDVFGDVGFDVDGIRVQKRSRQIDAICPVCRRRFHYDASSLRGPEERRRKHCSNACRQRAYRAGANRRAK